MAVRAPIDDRALRHTLAPFEEARTLPAASYISEEVFDWEQKNLFDSTWVCAGRTSGLAAGGDQLARRVGSDEVLFVRGEDGALRGYFNTCRHRGHELLPCGDGPINRRSVQCPYHRWIYGLDGRFKGGPGLAAQAGFDRTDPEHSLVPVRLREWGGWIFVNISGDAPPFEETIGNLDELVGPYELDRLIPAVEHSYQVSANWKVINENYHECYHCGEIHPELCAVTPPYSGEDYAPTGAWVGGSMELMEHATTMSLTGESLGVPLRGLDDDALRTVHYVGLFPNLLLSPHPDYVMAHRMEPLGPGRTFIECTWLFPPEALVAPGFDPSYAADFWDVTNRQDWTACESVQRGIGGRGYRQAPFSQHESTVHAFMAMVARSYLAGRPVPATPSGAPSRSGASA
ncbi:MAG: aromatic ring-hydroxylating dioxygenase subunit alpha [Actinobacteria bacterium]|nr:aromatic ring-hydroxylating dioxygenase subunit alpha [Actinomycetota bacterium]